MRGDRFVKFHRVIRELAGKLERIAHIVLRHRPVERRFLARIFGKCRLERRD